MLWLASWRLKGTCQQLFLFLCSRVLCDILAVLCSREYLVTMLATGAVASSDLGETYLGASWEFAGVDLFALLGLADPVCSGGVCDFAANHSRHRHDRAPRIRVVSSV